MTSNDFCFDEEWTEQLQNNSRLSLDMIVSKLKRSASASACLSNSNYKFTGKANRRSERCVTLCDSQFSGLRHVENLHGIASRHLSRQVVSCGCCFGFSGVLVRWTSPVRDVRWAAGLNTSRCRWLWLHGVVVAGSTPVHTRRQTLADKWIM